MTFWLVKVMVSPRFYSTLLYSSGGGEAYNCMTLHRIDVDYMSVKGAVLNVFVYAEVRPVVSRHYDQIQSNVDTFCPRKSPH